MRLPLNPWQWHQQYPGFIWLWIGLVLILAGFGTQVALFVELAGHIPAPGEEIEVEGVCITARDVEGTRIRSLLVRPRAEADREEDDAQAHN